MRSKDSPRNQAGSRERRLSLMILGAAMVIAMAMVIWSIEPSTRKQVVRDISHFSTGVLGLRPTPTPTPHMTRYDESALGAESAKQEIGIESQPIAAAGKQETGWSASDTPSVVYTRDWTNLYSCPQTHCPVIEVIPPALFWNLPFTIKEDGWLTSSGFKSSDNKGYIRASDLTMTFPRHCTLNMPYSIGYITPAFAELGYTTERLRGIALEAERAIEETIGRDIFTYRAGEFNSVNMIIRNFGVSENEAWGVHRAITRFPNGTIGSFSIGIHSDMIETIRDNFSQSSLGVDAQIDNAVRDSVLHEMIHATGFGHLDDSGALMCGAPNCEPSPTRSIKQRGMTSADVVALRAWCTE